MVFAAAMGFLGGMMVMAALVTMFPSGAADRRRAARSEAAPTEGRGQADEERGAAAGRAAAAGASATVAAMSADAVEELRDRALTLPVQGIKRDELRDTFNETRGSSRRHEAIDVLAPRNTPVLAVEDGTIARLFLSDAGGITIYQFDPTATLLLLLRAPRALRGGLKEGDADQARRR